MNWEDYATLALVALFGLVCIIALGVAFWSLRWPSVKGRIEVSFVDQESGWTNAGGSFSKKETESFALAYSYEVDGVKYLGANIKPWGNSNWTARAGSDTDNPDSGKILWSGARDAAAWYRPDAIVDVYYCPLRPKWACLEPGGFMLPLLIGAVVFGLYFFGR